jgi:hypothetical protein
VGHEREREESDGWATVLHRWTGYQVMEWVGAGPAH